MLHLPQTLSLQHHQTMRLPRKVTLQHNQILRLALLQHDYPAKCCTCHRNCLQHHQTMRLPRKVTLQHDQILRLALLAPATEIVSPTLPNNALATKNWHSNMTKYCSWHYSTTTTPVLPSQMLHLPQKLSLQHHQTLRLPRKSDTPTWPNIAPGTTPLLLLQYYPAKCCTCHRNCLQHHQTMRLPRKVTLQHDQILRLALLQYYYSSTTQPNAAPATEIVSPTLPNNALATKNWHSNMTKYCAWHYSSTTTPVLPSQMLHLTQKLSLQHHQTLRLPRKSDTPTWPNIAPGTTPVLLLQYYPAKCCTCHRNCLQHHQTMRLPRKVTLQHDQILRLALLQYYYSSTTQPNAAPATEIVTPTLPNNALATKNWHSNMTKYCSWHYSTTTTPVLPSQMLHLPQKLSPTSPNNALATKSDTPTWPNIAPGTTPVLLLQYYPAKCCTCHRNCLSNITKQCACHQKLTLQHDQILLLALLHYYYSSTTQPNAAPATEIVSPTSPNTALVTKSDTPTWPNIAPGTTPVLLLQYYPAKCCTCHRNCHSNITKQCACHEKWHSNMTKYCAWHYSSTTTPVLPSQMLHLPQKLSLQDHQTMRLPRKVTLQHDQILRMPRKVTPQQFLRSQATKNSGHKRPKIAVTSDPPPILGLDWLNKYIIRKKKHIYIYTY